MSDIVTQANLHLFIPGKTAGVAMLISEKEGIPMEEALLKFYATNTYRCLEREETKYWQYSAAQLYRMLQDELDVTAGL